MDLAIRPGLIFKPSPRVPLHCTAGTPDPTEVDTEL